MTLAVPWARARARVPRRHVVSVSRRQGAARRSHPRRAAVRRADAAWETRSFGAASAAIVIAFVLALVYLGSATGVATAGYEAQRLQEQRDELRRQSALLDVELASLASPARIEAEAQRLGLVHLSFVPVVPAQPIAAQR